MADGSAVRARGPVGHSLGAAATGMVRRELTWKTKLKMAVFGPSAASATLLVCPTHAVSTCAAQTLQLGNFIGQLRSFMSR